MAAGCAALVVPLPAHEVVPDGPATPFRWDADELFAALEAELEAAERAPAGARARLTDIEAEADRLLAHLDTAALPSEALAALATLQMRAAVQGAAHAELLPRVLDLVVRTRVEVMRAAAAWPLDREAHEAVHRVIAGGRMALDEALVQAGVHALPELVQVEDIPSATPSVVVEGVRVHSGDILLSRGGAPTSALIARGNDFANTFSHAALVHVDEETGEATVVEALIEAGSVTSTVEEYLAAKKHRILVLRLRPDHPALVADPMLPHRAAEWMLERVRGGHIPYDFAMAWSDPERAFCSEIVYHAYREQGVELWSIRSSMSSPGLVAWLGAMGVRELTSLVPSDLEYDPQVRAVAEWRNADALTDFRLDNAVIDALLEEAERGARLGYAWWALPGARALKAWSVGQELAGVRPLIPEGMSPSTALRVDALVSRVHPAVKARLAALAAEHAARTGRQAPYWTLVDLAREALAAERGELAPALRRP
ncbi:MAG TPA: YiiX/YebB-like N1pC/P60 family cysteine hydrolase [Longimicrobiales bacterium]|nr:YiiX/YebB-like N1pC/P60 family cysteine hydrolase [Longimicrobiales bacterium]